MKESIVYKLARRAPEYHALSAKKLGTGRTVPEVQKASGDAGGFGFCMVQDGPALQHYCLFAKFFADSFSPVL